MKGGVIWLDTCACELCKGRAAVCTAAFDWLDRNNPLHAAEHAQEDLLKYFDRLPSLVKDALNQAEVNVCSWCALIWVREYGAEHAAQLVRDVRFVAETRAATPIDGWKQPKGKGNR